MLPRKCLTGEKIGDAVCVCFGGEILDGTRKQEEAVVQELANDEVTVQTSKVLRAILEPLLRAKKKITEVWNSHTKMFSTKNYTIPAIYPERV